MNFENASYSEIIGHILKDHHAYLKEVLPELERLSFTIFKVHFLDSGQVLERLHKEFAKLKASLDSHMIKEERVLFFGIKDYEKDPSEELLGEVKGFIKGVREENEEILGLAKSIREITDNYTLPESSCATYEKTYDMLRELEEDLQAHMKAEEILFNKLG